MAFVISQEILYIEIDLSREKVNVRSPTKDYAVKKSMKTIKLNYSLFLNLGISVSCDSVGVAEAISRKKFFSMEWLKILNFIPLE